MPIASVQAKQPSALIQVNALCILLMLICARETGAQRRRYATSASGQTEKNSVRSAVGTVITDRPTGSPEAVARPRLPQNVACGFPAPRSSAVGSQLSLLSLQVSFPWSADLLLE